MCLKVWMIITYPPSTQRVDPVPSVGLLSGLEYASRTMPQWTYVSQSGSYTLYHLVVLYRRQVKGYKREKSMQWTSRLSYTYDHRLSRKRRIRRPCLFLSQRGLSYLSSQAHDRQQCGGEVVTVCLILSSVLTDSTTTGGKISSVSILILL